MERTWDIDDNLTLKTVRIDSDNVYLAFYENGKRLTQVPEGYKLIYHLNNGVSEGEQEPFEGTFVLYFARSYSLRKNGVTKVTFKHNIHHTVTIL